VALEAAELVRHEWNGRQYTLYEMGQLRNRYNRQIKTNLNEATAWAIFGNEPKILKSFEKLSTAMQKQSDEIEISKEEAKKAQISSQTAYNVIVEHQNKRMFDIR